MKDIRQRMIEDMKLRGLSPCTQATYLEAVKVLARHHNSRLDEITKEHEREIRNAFRQTLAVRAKGREACELADRFFFETLVRVHRGARGSVYRAETSRYR